MRRNLLLVFLTAVAFSAGSNAAPAKVESRPTDDKLRVIISSDFPPIGVVKGGNVPNPMKSDPDDMQSMVRFLLYANEFDVEGLIASAGTFAMEAHKENILGVLDQYEKVYENLKTHDPDYPTADYLRSVTFEGKANTNHYVDGPGASSISKWRKDYQKEFAERADWCVETPPAKLKPRVVVLTDISTWETDDHESLIRLLVHADMFEIEALILSTGYSIDTLNDSTKSGFINLINGAIDAYEKDLPNLMKRSSQAGHEFDDARQEIGYWPSAQYLRNRTMTGSRNRGKHFIGDDNDSTGSNLIIKLADENDDRPIWVTVWGGGNTVAQSIYRIKKDRNTEQFKAFLRKIRVYAITDQDRTYTGAEPLSYSSHGWIREQTGSDLLFIWDECAWKAHNGTGKSNWDQYETHIQGHGNLGSQYPKYKYGVEGDTPSFLYLMPTGLNNPEDPSQCSWGGTFSGDANNLWRESSSCRSFFDRFYPAAFNNFAARMDWAKNGAGNRNPVIVLDGDDGISVLTKTPKPGATLTLDASNTFDPDGDNLTFKWWIQSDAGTYPGNVNISHSSSSIGTINVPSDSTGKTFHVICEVIDDGTHNLSDYRRIIFKPVQ